MTTLIQCSDSPLQVQQFDQVQLVRELDQIQDLIQVNLNQFSGPNFTEALRDVQLVEFDVSILGLSSPPSSCGLGVFRCLDDIPRGVLRVQSAAAPG